MSLDLKFCKKILELGDMEQVMNSGVEPKYLYDDKARQVYKFIREYYRNYSNQEEGGVLPSEETIKDKVGVELVETDDSFEYLVSEIKARYQINELKEHVKEGLDSAEEGNASGFVQSLKSGLSKIHKEDLDKGGTVVDFSDTIDDRVDYYKQLKLQEGVEGIETPWPSLNHYSNGWQGGNVDIIAGRTSSGKTFLELKCALEAWYNDHRVLFITTEMTEKKIGRRVDSIHAEVPFDDLIHGELNTFYEEQLLESMEDFKEGGFKVVPNGFASSTADIDMLISQYSPDIVFIDGIYLIEPSNQYSGLTQKLNMTLSEVKFTSLRHDTPIVGTTQLNRNATGSGGPGGVSNIAYSDKVGWDASVVVTIDQDDDMDDELKLIVSKSRDGGTGEFMINFDFEEMDFSEIEEPETEDYEEVEKEDDFVGGQVQVDNFE